MHSKVIEFIKNFHISSETLDLFTDCACYWFAEILALRFGGSVIYYNPHIVHFATMVGDKLYDIRGAVMYPEDYIEWSVYKEQFPETVESIEEACINLRR